MKIAEASEKKPLKFFFSIVSEAKKILEVGNYRS